MNPCTFETFEGGRDGDSRFYTLKGAHSLLQRWTQSESLFSPVFHQMGHGTRQLHVASHLSTTKLHHHAGYESAAQDVLWASWSRRALALTVTLSVRRCRKPVNFGC